MNGWMGLWLLVWASPPQPSNTLSLHGFWSGLVIVFFSQLLILNFSTAALLWFLIFTVLDLSASGILVDGLFGTK